jgi:hypothetical protein
MYQLLRTSSLFRESNENLRIFSLENGRLVASVELLTTDGSRLTADPANDLEILFSLSSKVILFEIDWSLVYFDRYRSTIATMSEKKPLIAGDSDAEHFKKLKAYQP